MFNKNTIIVVGAGASKEANLPTGHELKQKIASVLDIRFDGMSRKISGDPVVYEALRETIRRDNPNDGNINSYLEAAWIIRDAMPQAISIDQYIDAHQGNDKLKLCGKLAIVRAILDAERHSLLFDNTRDSNKSLDYQALEDTWLTAFMQLLTENCSVEQLKERLSLIKFIVFNYDRCIEHFLYHSLQNYYNIIPAQAAELVRDIKIYHPYGTVGKLPWDERSNAIGFGEEPYPGQLIDLADQIRTFTEGTDPTSSDIEAIRRGMAESQIIIFLGFAFHRLNLQLIQHETHVNPVDLYYYGTAKGISPDDCDVITTELVELSGSVIHSDNIILRNDLECSLLVLA